MPDKPSFYSRDPKSGGKVSDKASFYSKDRDAGSSDPDDADGKKYMGQERRRGNRRKGQDRRGEVRFDINSDDRRQNAGRRKTDKSPKFW